jgi:ClpP class serine protease
MLKTIAQSLGFRRQSQATNLSPEHDAIDGAALEAFEGIEANDAAGGGGQGKSMPPDWQELVARIQKARDSHVIGLIHRHDDGREMWESWYFDAMIGAHHLQDFTTALQSVPPGARLDIVLHSIGGFSLEVQQIARAIKAHRGETTIFVPHYAHGFSTLIAVAGDQIVMGPAATLSFLEPPDKTLANVIREKGARRTQDMTFLRQSMTRNFARELRAFITEVAPGKTESVKARIAQEICGGRKSPWDPMTATLARKAGLPVSTDMPQDVFSLIRACRAAPARDHGVKTVMRTMSATRANRLLPQDLDYCLTQGITISQPEWSRDRNDLQRLTPAPANYSDDDGDDDDPFGVSLEHCDITIRPLIAQMEAARGSRVICIIHQAGMESDFVDTVTTEDILTALQVTPPDKPIDIILHTPGGYSYQAHQIALAVKAHRGRKTVFVPYFAMSGGTIISLAADEIVLAPNGVLGPIDSQFPVSHLRRMVATRAILDLVDTKPRTHIHDELLELAVMCRRTIVDDHRNALDLMRNTYSPQTAERIAHALNDGIYTHGFPVTYATAKKLGLNVSTSMPPEAMAIMRAFRRNRSGKRSVIYCL